MKHKLILIAFVICLFVCGSYTTLYKKTAGSHPGSTGAPLDQTCAQSGCHTDAAVIPNAVNNNTLIFQTPDSSYIPGATYNITVQVQGSGASPTTKFGFELVPIKDADSTCVGQLSITDLNPLRTQLLAYTQAAYTRTSVTHKTAGTAAISTNFNRWTFSWTAPPVNEGKITFWYATNCTNNNGLNTGDRIYLHSFQIHPANTTSIKEIANEYELKAFFDNEASEMIISYDLKGQRNVQISIFDVAGKNVYSNGVAKLSGVQKQRIPFGTNYSKGTYLIQLQINDQKVTKKVIVN